jgi:hypothetical protein
MKLGDSIPCHNCGYPVILGEYHMNELQGGMP